MKLFSWLKTEPHHPAALAYRAGTPARVGRKLPADELRFVVLDVETTGFDPAKDRILSLAAVPVRARAVGLAEIRSWVLFQRDTKLTDAVCVHGILPEDTRAGEQESDVLAELLPIVTGAVLVGHHIGFDVRMISAALQRNFGLKLQNPMLDTATLAMNALEAFRKSGYPGQRAPSLDEVCTHLDLAPLERHTAAGDAFTTAELFLLLCAKQAKHIGRPLTAADLPIERA